ncbi:glycoside hydrolase family 97 catalytic domain-containing protein [Glycomyces harbinensis]|uniref:Glycosyl-hydrolase 97 C-terminal, oligomerisation n=1 Tax=Glycomyces harbinensis TaxID=58114 RepID=A0A1G6XCM5_9ACTN|nr:glycoside hydrolase family 97 catalytic domain-containing protein [Glycomyces harbinensis]SDD75046.1 Glycosyl-hydrolase 97 C-terminal, oligomerisation [Glycomyces harbinensis]
MVNESSSGTGLEVRPDGIALSAPGIDGLRLGLRLNGIDLGEGSSLLRSSEREIAEEWTARSGKAVGTHRYRHVEQVHELRHESGLEWQIHVRTAADGIAVRYAAARLEGHGRLTAEHTLMRLDPSARVWALDYQTWYETPRFGADLPDLKAGAYGFPLLARTGEDRYLLVTESGIDGRFSGAHAQIEDGALAFAAADADVEVTRGPLTPWRVFLRGSLAAIVESRFVDELAPAPLDPAVDTSWVRPGRAAWSWWSDFYSGAQLERQRHFVDAAARLGWEHLLIDCGWDETWVPEIVSYASRRGVQVHLWAVWHDLDGPEGLAKLALWRSWGVAGVKVDFMESESKDRYRWYDTVLAETARLGLHVNFHGSVIPRGWARTWPQVVGYEAIRGSEYYVFYDDTPLTAAHNVIQPFTRNVAGAMDYTPVAFSAPGRTTSDGHELALSVAFECGITHFADDVDAYLARPEAARFLAELAPSWDETRLLAGDPDREAVIARRSGDRWFIGAVATGEARTLTVPLDRIAARADAWIVRDGPDGLAAEHRTVDGSFTVELKENGGFVAILAPEGAPLFRSAERPELAAPNVEPAIALAGADGTAEIRTDPGATVRLAPGWSADDLGAGRWRVRAPRALAPGRAGVVTVEVPGPEVPVVAHARVVRPLTEGAHRLSSVSMAAFANESGPVERDLSNGGGNPGDGRPMSIAGKAFDDGLGASTPSRIDLYPGGGADRLTVLVGVDDETPGTAARVSVHGDGRELFAADVRSGEPALDVALDLRGVTALTLRSDALPEHPEPAHIDWAAGRLHVDRPQPVEPLAETGPGDDARPAIKE